MRRQRDPLQLMDSTEYRVLLYYYSGESIIHLQPPNSAGMSDIRQELDPCGGEIGGDPDGRQPRSTDKEDFCSEDE